MVSQKTAKSRLSCQEFQRLNTCLSLGIFNEMRCLLRVTIDAVQY